MTSILSIMVRYTPTTPSLHMTLIQQVPMWFVWDGIPKTTPFLVEQPTNYIYLLKGMPPIHRYLTETLLLEIRWLSPAVRVKGRNEPLIAIATTNLLSIVRGT